MAKRNCVIVHGCPDIDEKDSPKRTYDKHWIPWTKRTLDSHGIPTSTPLMPQPWTPVYEKFKKAFDEETVNEHTILIGHSCGCAFLVRWLGDTKRKIATLVLVAPWKIADGKDASRKAFYGYSIDPTIKKRVGKIVIFTADDEEPDGKKSVQIFHKALGGQTIELKKHGHYTIGDMKTEKFPELIDEVL